MSNANTTETPPAKPRETSAQREEREHREKVAQARERAASEAEVDAALKSSFPVRCRELLIGVAIAASRFNSKAFTSACAAHAEEVAALRADVENLARNLCTALVDAATADDVGAVFGSIEQVRADKPIVLQRIVGAWHNAAELAKQKSAELLDVPERLEAEANQLAAEVAAQLTALGSGIESMIAWPKYGPAAERQFAFAVRQNTRVRPALAAAKDAHAEQEAATQCLARTRRGHQAASDELRKLAAQMISH